MIEELKVCKKWFVGKDIIADMDDINDRLEMNLSVTDFEGVGYSTIFEIPKEKVEEGIIFQAYQFEYNGKAVYFSRPHGDMKLPFYFFPSEQGAEEFRRDLLEEMEDYYWGYEEERIALAELNYDIDEGEDFSEISMNEDRRWNEYLSKWYLRSFDGLGYEMNYNGEIIEF